MGSFTGTTSGRRSRNMKLNGKRDQGRQCLSNSRKWLFSAVLLAIGFNATPSIWAQGSQTRFGFLEDNPTRSSSLNQGFGVYSTTALPPVNTSGFTHAGIAVERGSRVALLSTPRQSLPTGGSNGLSVPPPNLMVVSGLPANRSVGMEPTVRRRFFPRRTEEPRTTKEGYYIHSKTRTQPARTTSVVRKTTSQASKPRPGLRNLFRRK